MVTIPYLRASTQAVRLDQQRLAVFDYYARKQRLTVDEFVETKRSSQRVTPSRGLMQKIEALQRGDPHRLRIFAPGPKPWPALSCH